jgi:rhodanese-related sulfurtransferase
VKEHPVPSRAPLAPVLALALLAALLGCAAEDLAPSISAAELRAQMASGDAPLVVDVRTPEEFRAGHIPGAINVPYDQVAAHAAELASPKGVAMYCLKGPRARLGEQALLSRAITRVLHVEGGFAAWQAAGLPVAQ